MCHVVDGKGGKIGPDLTGIGTRARSEILLDIIDSNRSVDAEFRLWTVTTKGGDWAVNNIWEAYPGDDAVDVIGVNRYDFPGLGPISMNWRDTCWNTQDICYAADFARRRGKPMALVKGDFAISSVSSR